MNTLTNYGTLTINVTDGPEKGVSFAQFANAINRAFLLPALCREEDGVYIALFPENVGWNSGEDTRVFDQLAVFDQLSDVSHRLGGLPVHVDVDRGGPGTSSATLQPTGEKDGHVSIDNCEINIKQY